MADDTTVTIAKGVEEALKMSAGLKEEMLKALDYFKQAGQESVSFGELATKAGDKAVAAFSGLINPIKDISKIFGGLKEGAEAATSSIQSLFDDTVSSFDSMMKDMASTSQFAGTDILLALEPLVGVLDKNITGMGKLGDTGYEAGSKITTAFRAVQPLLAGIIGSDSAGMKFITAITEGSSRVVGMERELIGFAVAQGRVSDISEEAGHRFKNLNEDYRSFTEMTFQSAQATGQTVGAVMDLGKALSTIPGALDSGNAIIQVSRLATAVGREQSDVAAQATEMYTRFGASIQDAAQAIAYIQDKAGDSNLRMKAFNDTVMQISGSFKMLGDNTLATTNFVSAFDKAFDGSKISPAALKEVITTIGEGIERLNVGQKAFISGSTGGPGGLAGAVQMDYAIQEGKVDEVIKRTMVSMQNQFGGQVVTLKDAAENPALAGELYKQVQYLTQVSGIAQNDKQAYRILEAMKSGVTDMLKPGAASGEKEDAMTRQMDKGFDLQQQTQTTLMNIHQTMEKARLRQDDIYHAMLIQNPDLTDRISGIIGTDNAKKSLDMESAKGRAEHQGFIGIARSQSGETGREQYQPVAPNTGVSNLLSNLGIGDLGTSGAADALFRITGKNQTKLAGPTEQEANIVGPKKSPSPTESEEHAGIFPQTLISRKMAPPPGMVMADLPGQRPPVLPTVTKTDREKAGLSPVSISGEVTVNITGDMLREPIKATVLVNNTTRQIAMGR